MIAEAVYNLYKTLDNDWTERRKKNWETKKGEITIREVGRSTRIENVDGNYVDPEGDNIAIFDEGTNTAIIPNFSNISLYMKGVPSHVRDFFKAYVIDPLRRYVLGHEIQVEAYMNPQTEREHSLYEREYLESLRESGQMLTYLVGLSTHKLRLKYGDRTGFSSGIRTYLDDKIRKYAKVIEKIEPMVELALEPVPGAV